MCDYIPFLCFVFVFQIARQDFYLQKQRFLIEQLTQQQARHVLLGKAFVHEQGMHTRTLQLLDTLAAELKHYRES